MSLHPQEPPSIPEETNRVARAPFPERISLSAHRRRTWVDLHRRPVHGPVPRRGKHAEASGRLALATVLQFVEGLSDRQAADAVPRTERRLQPGPWFTSARTSEFTELYQETLGKLDLRQVVDELHAIAGGKVPVLCCFEQPNRPPTWCHRSLTASWLAQSLGIVVPELGFQGLPQALHPLRPPEMLIPCSPHRAGSRHSRWQRGSVRRRACAAGFGIGGRTRAPARSTSGITNMAASRFTISAVGVPMMPQVGCLSCSIVSRKARRSSSPATANRSHDWCRKVATTSPRRWRHVPPIHDEGSLHWKC